MQKIFDDLKETIISYVRKQIFEDRTLSLGSRLNEREIARDLNISRAPIREAFKELEAQGSIVSIKYKGWLFISCNSSLSKMLLTNSEPSEYMTSLAPY